MTVSGISSGGGEIERLFQPSTANVSRPHPNSETEMILELFDGKPQRPGKLTSNHLNYPLGPQLDFTA